MTEQQNQSAVVEETREAVETTPQPENTEKKKAGNKTSLALSAIAIAIAIARRHRPVWPEQTTGHAAKRNYL